MSKDIRDQRGFTLIEFLVAMVVAGALTLGIGAISGPAIDLWATQTLRYGDIAESKLAMERVKRDISQVRDVQSVQTAQSAQFRFTDTSNQSVTFALSSGNLTRNGVVLAKGVSSLQFTYWDINNTVLSSPTVSPSNTNIARIGLTMTTSALNQSQTVQMQVRPRNF